MPHLKKWKLVRKALLFRLSNKIIQVQFQEDRSEIIICSNTGVVTYVNSGRHVKRLPLTSDIEKLDPSMFKRLQFSKEILLQFVSKKSDKS